MSTVLTDEKIPNNVNLSSDKRLQRALEAWQPAFIDWWKDMGPVGWQERDIYLRTAVSVETDGWAHFDYVKMPDYRWGIFLEPKQEGRVHGFGDFQGQPVWDEVPGEFRNMLRHDRYCRNGGRVAVVGHPVVGATASEGYHVIEVPNQELAGRLAAELAAGRDGDFVIIGGPEGLYTSDDRIRGFQEGLARAGHGPAEVLRSAFNRSGGYDAGLQLAARIKAAAAKDAAAPKMCIFAVNDVMAIGAAAALRSEGLRIPRDASIAGFDDIETLRDFRPALSTVRLPLEDIGRLATRATRPRPAGEDQDAAPAEAVTGEVTLRRSTEAAAV